MAADGSVIIEILGDAKQFTKTLSGIAGGAVKGLTTAIAGTSAALGGITTAAAKVGAGFEESMSQVAATMGLSVEEIQNGSAEFEALSKAAEDAGATTAFSASEAAAGLNYLALAGYDAATSAEVLPSVLNLAAAGGMDLAYASDLATDAMAALGIEASNENLTKFGDQMARTASKANASVGQLGEAILTVGGTAKSLAGGTTELNAALGVLANRGIKGAEGGTALRNIILSLSAPTDKAKKLMDGLGISVYDAFGNIRPLNDVFSDLNIAMQSMTEGEKTNVLSDIFNKVDLKSAEALLAGTGEEFDSLSAAIENSQGAMQNMADVQLDNLTGDITILKSGLEGLGIALYQTMQVNARGAVQAITEAVNDISGALRDDGISAAIEAAGRQVAGFATKIAEYAPTIIDAGAALIQAFLQGIHDNLPEIANSAIEIVTGLIEGILEILPQLLSVGLEILLAIVQGLADAIPQLIPALTNVILQIVDILTDPDTLSGLVEAGLKIMVTLARGIADAIPQLLHAIPKIISNIITVIIAELPSVIAAGIDIIFALIDGIIGAIPELIAAIPNLVIGIAGGILENLDKIILAGPQIVMALIEGILGAIPALLETIPALLASLVDAITSIDWASIGKNIVEGIRNGISDMWNSLVEWVQSKFDDLLSTIKNIFPGGGSSGRRSPGGDSPRSTSPMRSAPAAYSAESPAVANAVPALKSAPAALSAPALESVNSGIAARLRSAVEAEASRMSANLTVNSNVQSASRSGHTKAADGPSGNGAPIIVRPRVVMEVNGELAPLVREMHPVFKAEDARVGAGI